MKRVLLLLYCLSLPFAIRAEVIDRIVAVVDGHIITATTGSRILVSLKNVDSVSRADLRCNPTGATK